MPKFDVMRVFDVDEAQDCESIEALHKINEATHYSIDLKVYSLLCAYAFLEGMFY